MGWHGDNALDLYFGGAEGCSRSSFIHLMLCGLAAESVLK
jgi:hypothetical protein